MLYYCTMLFRILSAPLYLFNVCQVGVLTLPGEWTWELNWTELKRSMGTVPIFVWHWKWTLNTDPDKNSDGRLIQIGLSGHYETYLYFQSYLHIVVCMEQLGWNNEYILRLSVCTSYDIKVETVASSYIQCSVIHFDLCWKAEHFSEGFVGNWFFVSSSSTPSLIPRVYRND